MPFSSIESFFPSTSYPQLAAHTAITYQTLRSMITIFSSETFGYAKTNSIITFFFSLFLGVKMLHRQCIGQPIHFLLSGVCILNSGSAWAYNWLTHFVNKNIFESSKWGKTFCVLSPLCNFVKQANSWPTVQMFIFFFVFIRSAKLMSSSRGGCCYRARTRIVHHIFVIIYS